MKEKARFFAEKLKYLGFKASDGWMEKTARKTQHYFFIKTFIDTFLTALIFSFYLRGFCLGSFFQVALLHACFPNQSK